MSTSGEGRSGRRYRALGAVATSLTVGWASFALYALHPALAFNPLRLPMEADIRLQRWTPEGWKFFTRNPREDHTLVFGRTADGAWVDVDRGPNFTASNYFGISRRARALGIELALLVHDVSKNNWAPCSETPEACLERAEHSIALTNHTPEPMLCGTIGFVMQKQVPWAWASLPNLPIMPSRVMRLEVRC